MYILGLDTSLVEASAVLMKGQDLLSMRLRERGGSFSQNILSMINELIDEVSIDISDVETIAVAVGPGSFTGLRIGLGASLGLSDCFGAVVAGIGTLDAMVRVSDDTKAAYLCPIIAARRGQVYSALYSRKGGVTKKLTDDMETSVDALAEMIDGDVLFIGDGFSPHADFFREKIGSRVEAIESPTRSCAEGVALLANEMAENGELSATPVIPRYVSRPQAELNLMKLQT